MRLPCGSISLLDRNISHKPTKGTRRWVFDFYLNKCVYCGDYANTLDHVIPVSQGGGSGIGNLVLACRRCNTKKGNSYLVCSVESKELGFWAGKAGFRPIPFRDMTALPRLRDTAFGAGTVVRVYQEGQKLLAAKLRKV